MDQSPTAVVVNYGLAVAGLIFGIIQFFQKIRADKKLFELRQKYDTNESILEKRFKIYSEYIGKLDRINADLSTSLSGADFQGEVKQMFIDIQSGKDSQEVLRGYMTKISERTMVWGSARTKALEELSGLRLVCSEPILRQLDAYAEQTKLLIDSLGKTLQTLITDPGRLMDASVGDQVKAAHSNLNYCIASIQGQMRIDLGIAPIK